MIVRTLSSYLVHRDQVYIVCGHCGHFAVRKIVDLAELIGGLKLDTPIAELERRHRCGYCTQRKSTVTLDRPAVGARLCPKCGNPLWDTGERKTLAWHGSNVCNRCGQKRTRLPR